MKKTTTIALISLLLYGCTNNVKTRFSGDHPTSQIRDMWTVCYVTKARTQPHIPPPMHWVFCDCVTDKSRETFSTEQYKETDNLTQFFTDASIECDAKNMVAPEPALHKPKLL